MTDFTIVYKRFYSKITDDMYMELDEAETDALLEELLINALPWFEFPRVNINNYDLLRQRFNINLTNEEINIIATYMMLGWLDQQLASVELVRMKYSGSDFKFTSQANHMAKLTALRKEYERIGLHLQRLYKRRKTDSEGKTRSTFGAIMASSVRNGIVTDSFKDEGSSVDPIPPTDNPSEDGSWEDMEDIPSNKPNENPPGSDGWDEMEDLPVNPEDPEDGWDSM